MASTSTAAAFYAQFAQMKAEFTSALENDAAPAQSLSNLRSSLAAVRANLPPYDQRSYDLQIKELEGKLATRRGAAKPKFAFKSRRAPAKDTDSGTDTKSESAQIDTSAPSPDNAPKITSAATPSTYTLSSRTNELLTEVDISPEGNYTLTLSDLQDCVVDLRPVGTAALTSLHASNLSRCILLAPLMAGSAMLSGVKDSLLILGSQQFRLHHSEESTIALNVPSFPVIEGCDKLVFGPYSPSLGGGAGSRHDQVQDFDWVRGGPSPHWRAMRPDEEQGVEKVVSSVLGGDGVGALQYIPCIQRYTN